MLCFPDSCRGQRLRTDAGRYYLLVSVQTALHMRRLAPFLTGDRHLRQDIQWHHHHITQGDTTNNFQFTHLF